ncbi:MAG: TolC family protein [Candidatus Sulfobium sp.]|jgi:outer membrane protein
MYRRIVFITVLAVACNAVWFSAATWAEKTLTLTEAVQYSLKDNPGVLAFRESVLAQKEDIGIARSLMLPKLNFEERYMRTNNPTYAFMAKLNQERFSQQDFAISSLNSPSPINDFQTSFSLEQAVFAPKAYIALDMAKKEAAARGDEFDRKKEETAFRVFKTYLGVQTAKAYVGVAEKGVEDAKEHRRIAESRYRNNLGLYSDVLRAQVAMSSAEEKMVSARKNLAVAKRALGLMLGLTESVNVTDERPSFEVRNIDHYYDKSLQRKDLHSLQERYRNARNALKMANAGYLPVVGVGGTYQLNDHRSPFAGEGDSWQLVAFLRWHIFDGTRREHEREKAKHKIAETGEYLDGFRKELRFRVYDAYLGVDESKKGLELAKAALKSAEEGRRLVLKRYENSLSTIVDLLDVQTSLDAARADVVRKEGAYLTAIANLGFQSGTLLHELGVEDRQGPSAE